MKPQTYLHIEDACELIGSPSSAALRMFIKRAQERTGISVRRFRGRVHEDDFKKLIAAEARRFAGRGAAK